jgi:hypothetical protein
VNEAETLLNVSYDISDESKLMANGNQTWGVKEKTRTDGDGRGLTLLSRVGIVAVGLSREVSCRVSR